jgi:tRNA-dihydrouridine synthase B
MKDIKVYMAPLLGITGCVYRSTFNRHFGGITRYYAPFIRGTKMKGSALRNFRELRLSYNRGFTLVPQLLTNNRDDLVHMCNKLAESGYDHVNINMGCPYPMVTKKNRGAGLLASPDRVEALFNDISDRISVKLSVKMRLGIDDPRQCLPVLRVLNRYTLEEIIMHPRTADQLYNGAVDLDGFSEAAKISKHPLLFNGDLRSVNDCHLIMKKLNHDSPLMIGRGLISDPFLPWRLNGTMAGESKLQQVMERFHRDLVEGYLEYLHGPRHVLDKMKEVWLHLCLAFEDSRKVLKMVRKTKSIDALHDIVSSIMPTLLPGGPHQLEQGSVNNYTSW